MSKFKFLLIILIFTFSNCTIDNGHSMRLVCGTGQAGFVDGNEALLNKPIRLTTYNDTSVIFADINNHSIRMATISGVVTTIAGGPENSGYKDGPASMAQFNSPHGVAFDNKTNNVYVAEAGNHVIRVIHIMGDGDHEVFTLAGIPERSGYRDGAVDSALFSSPHALILGPNDEIIVADIGNGRIRQIKDGIVSTIAGTGIPGSLDGTPEEASFLYPMDMVLDGSDILVADAGTHLIRRIKIGEAVSTVVLQDTLNTPHGIAIDEDKNIYIADMRTHRILRVDESGKISIVAGTGEMGAGLEMLNKPAALLMNAGYLWIADLNNHQLKAIRI